jgi:hypothetical protein
LYVRIGKGRRWLGAGVDLAVWAAIRVSAIDVIPDYAR